jgi:hypothetical protein
VITQQGLRESLYLILEWGYKSCERGENIQTARASARAAIAKLVKASGLEREILRIKMRTR